MTTRDIFQSISTLDANAIQKVVDRLEHRATDPAFVRMRATYFDRMGLTPTARILDCGCGTGVVSRALARRDGFAGMVVAIDVSAALIDAAKRFARNEGVDQRIEFTTGDCHALKETDESFDFVIAHTLISHVANPGKVISEAARVLRPQGTIVIFDGDYASLAFGAGDAMLNAKMVQGILAAVVANPTIMRMLPAMLKASGLEVAGFIPEVLAEAGRAAFFLGLAESYVPIAVTAGTIAVDDGNRWLAAQREAANTQSFFGACNYYTYLLRKPG
jgi:ubiquinone/menaquinone biosynthesis C-methylase UbiE